MRDNDIAEKVLIALVRCTHSRAFLRTRARMQGRVPQVAPRKLYGDLASLIPCAQTGRVSESSAHDGWAW